jgi:hypothetical protein
MILPALKLIIRMLGKSGLGQSRHRTTALNDFAVRPLLAGQRQSQTGPKRHMTLRSFDGLGCCRAHVLDGAGFDDLPAKSIGRPDKAIFLTFTAARRRLPSSSTQTIANARVALAGCVRPSLR